MPDLGKERKIKPTQFHNSFSMAEIDIHNIMHYIMHTIVLTEALQTHHFLPHTEK